MRIRMHLLTRIRRAPHALKHLAGSVRKASPASYYAVERAEWLFYVSYLQAGMTVFDIGANVGILTHFFSHFVRTSGQVHAFEPAADSFRKLKTVCEIAQCKNVYLNHAAVAD